MPLINGETAQEYVFQEYPKWVKLPDGTSVIVDDAFQEHKVLGTSPKEDEVEPEFVGFREDAAATVATVAIEEVAPIEEKDPVIVPVIAPDGEVIAEAIDSLRSQADRLGLIYDKRWGAVKLQQAINNAAAQGALSGE